YEQRTERSQRGENGIAVEVVNSVLYNERNPLKREFKNFIDDKYDAEIDDANFETDGEEIMRKVNNYMRQKTRGNIQRFLKNPLPSNTKFALLNALYFSGEWKRTFSSKQTQQGQFQNADQTESQVQYMQQQNAEYNHYVDNAKKVTVIELPYQGDASMILMLPHSKNGLRSLIQQMSNSDVENWLQSMSRGNIASLKLPRMQCKSRVDLKQLLKNLGFKNVFGAEADYSGIGDQVEISAAIHKARVAFEEDGTEASAGTTANAGDQPSSATSGTNVLVKHPFCYIIRDQRNGINLLVGCVTRM
ncbi:secreted salivary gland peptide-like protein, partial [Dinothrombium tinctorium]